MPFIELERGQIYGIRFPYTFDPRYPNGKFKYVLVLQGGEYFRGYSTTSVLLISSNVEGEDQDHVVEIEKGSTDLPETSFIECSQPYTLLKSLFYGNSVRYKGHLDPGKMDEVDEALYIGLAMGQQHEEEN
ncbi:type II toxin-antitoxin system PemK/MazF family toxin [Rossellomorea aquimaris]|uniref:type II toxin-antitoxin system PemK/MazF family toxin n=1 Tax=Rossellomorea aquimaris TaxID=189382 RepID=UPI001CFF4409|nr:type II toxin-antitoxin system PemK/MazF family toxin [Rossellomorea aquimaris]